MPIPPFRPDGSLPPGEHAVSWSEIVSAFGYNDRRKALLVGLERAIAALRTAGASGLLLNGSFTTEKPSPNDYDACYFISDDHLVNLPPGLDAASMALPRSVMKSTYLGDLFPAQAFAVIHPSPLTYREFFQRDREGTPKGILLLDFGG